MKNMIKKAIIIIMLFVMLFTLTSCMSEEEWRSYFIYNCAIVEFPNGSIEKINIKEYYNHEDTKQVQLIAEDGTMYLVSSVNCVLVKE